MKAPFYDYVSKKNKFLFEEATLKDIAKLNQKKSRVKRGKKK